MKAIIALALVLGAVFAALPDRSSAEELSIEEAGYLGQILSLGQILNASTARSDALMDHPRLQDLDWRNDFIGETAIWAALYEQAKEIEVPERFVDLNTTLLEVYALMDDAGVETRSAIETMNLEGFASTMATAERAAKKLLEAEEILKTIDFT